MNMLNPQMVALIDSMNDKPIAFNRHYVALGCGINGALMLSQMVYWSKRTKDRNGFFYKTQDEWEEETGLGRREQETARKKLRELGFVSEHKRGVPCKVHFKVEHDALYTALIQYAQNSQSSMAESAKLECTNPPNSNGGKRQTNTENTTENTTDINLGASAPEQPKKFSAKKFLIENGVSEKTAQEFIDLKNKKRKTITDRSLKIIFNQAIEAKLSNERVFQIIVLRGWESFKAAWNWAETNAEIEQLENPQSTSTPEQQPAPVFKGVAKKFKGMSND